MELLGAAAVLGGVEVVLTALMFRSGRRQAQLREASGSSEPITMASSLTLAIWFFYHLPMVATFAASERVGERTKAVAVYLGTPLLYLAIFTLAGKRGLGWHGW